MNEKANLAMVLSKKYEETRKTVSFHKKSGGR